MQRAVRLLSLAALFASITGCRASAPAAGVSGDPYAVYSALLRETVLAEGWAGNPRHTTQRRPIELLVIAANTDSIPVDAGWSVSDRLSSMNPQTEEDFATKRGRHRLEEKFESAGSYVLLTQEERRTLFRGRADWRDFYARYPGAPGIVSFSPVGFGANGTAALVYMTHARAGNWGHRTAYLLRLQGGRWTVTEHAGVLQF